MSIDHSTDGTSFLLHCPPSVAFVDPDKVHGKVLVEIVVCLWKFLIDFAVATQCGDMDEDSSHV